MSRVLHRSGAVPPVALRGEGIVLHTADGRQIIDYVGLPQPNRDIAPLSRYESLVAEDRADRFSIALKEGRRIAAWRRPRSVFMLRAHIANIFARSISNTR